MYPIDSWFAVLESRELRRDTPLAARRLGLDLVFWRDGAGAVRCVSDRCPHRGAALSAGKVRDGTIECPFHGFRFDGEGACVKVPCNPPDSQRARHIDTRAFVVREVHGMIWLWWGEAREAGDYPDVPWFTELEGREHSSFFVDTAVNWQRNVENQLDWAHLPFVHATTIGRGYPEHVVARCEIDGDRLVTWVAHDETGDGIPGFHITFQFPNIWLNPLGDRVVAFVAFVPIDDEHSRMYFRTYVRRFAIPGLARLVGRAIDVANRVILSQDLRVLHTQPPTVDPSEERLVQADLPIGQFRKQLRRRAQPGVATVGGPRDTSALEPTG